MNVEKLFSGIPNEDTFLQISLENSKPEQILQEYHTCPEKCICIYGVSEPEIEQSMAVIRKRADYFAEKLSGKQFCDCTWDIVCKPILLVDTKKTATLFRTFANLLEETTFFDLITELQLTYNTPWTRVQLLTHSRLCDILNRYGQTLRFGLE